MKGQCSSGCSLSVSSRPSFLPFHSQTLNLTLARNIKVSAASSSPKLSLPSPWTSRRAALVATFSAISSSAFSNSPCWSKPLLLLLPEFFELPNSGGVKALDLRLGDGELPIDGDQVAIHYYGRLAAKQGWRFDSTYDHKDETGEPIPFTFILGSGKVIQGVEAAVRSMKVHGQRRVIIPPSQGYQNTSQEPIPPNFFDRQRLFTTIFNPTRLANGEGSTLGTLIFDIELVSLRHQ